MPSLSKQEVFSLLEGEGYTSRSKWEEASNNSAYRNVIGSNGERKQLFAEFLSYAKGKERESKRKAESEARLLYKAALAEYLPSVLDTVTFGNVADRFHSEKLWTVLSEEELDELYQASMDELERLPKNTNESRWLRIDRLKSIFESDDRFSPEAPFDDVLPLIERLVLSDTPTAIDRLLAWKEWVGEKKRSEDIRKKKAIFRRARKAREAFISILYGLGNKLADSHYSDIQPLIKDRDCYIELLGGRHSQPYDLFHNIRREIRNSVNTEITMD